MKLLELLSIANKEDILTAKRNKEKIQIMWDKGNIFTQFGNTYSFSTINLVLDFSKKLIRFWPMDDTSDFKFIQKLQNALKDLIKAEIIDLTYTVNIVDKKSTVKNIGSVKLKDVLDYDSSFTKKIPFAFHGTTSKYLPLIKKFGLVPLYKLYLLGYDIGQNFDKFYTEESEENIYLSIDYDLASQYARQVSKKIGGAPIIVMVKDLDISAVDADDDLLNNVGSAQLLNLIMGTGTKYNNYIDSIKANSQFSFKGRIPFSKIHKIEKISK